MVLLPILLVALGLVACSPTPAPAPTPSGPPQQLTLDNSSAKLQHDFDMTEGVAQPVKLTAQPGQTANVTFTIDKPGSYTFFCGQPGHEGAGMKGTITIQ